MMGEREGYEKELLEWKEYQFELRKRYRDTPPGFADADREASGAARLEEARQQYRENRDKCLVADSRMPEEIFVGRERLLAEVKRRLEGAEGPVILYGMGGMGKSAIAREYIRRRRQDYDHVVFLCGAGGIRGAVCDDSQLQITNLQYSREEFGSRETYFREKLAVLGQLALQKRILLVLDDWNKEKDRGVEAFFSTPCDILVTTRLNPAHWEREGLLVAGFDTREEWEAFLRAYGKKEYTEEERRELCEYCLDVGGHTLLMKCKAIEIAGEQKGEERAQMEPGAETPQEMIKNLFSHFSLKQEEKQVLREMCVLPPEGIPLSLYRRISRISDKTLERLELRLLVSRYVREGEEMVRLQPLAAKIARTAFQPTLTNCRRMVSAFCHALREAGSCGNAERAKFGPCVFAILEAFPQPEPWLARELSQMTEWLWTQGYEEEARQWQHRIVDVLEQCRSSDARYERLLEEAEERLSSLV